MDKIHIRNLRCRCIIGLNEDERINKQDVVINITLHTSTSPAKKVIVVRTRICVFARSRSTSLNDILSAPQVSCLSCDPCPLISIWPIRRC